MSEGVHYLHGAKVGLRDDASPEVKLVRGLEQSLLAALLLQPKQNVHKIPENFGPHHFLVDGHDRIYLAILAATDKGGDFILPVVRATVPDIDGEDGYVARLVQGRDGCGPDDVRQYAEHIMEAAAKREALKALDTARRYLAPKAGEPKPVAQVATALSAELERIASGQRKAERAVGIGEAIGSALQASEVNWNRVGPPGVPSGLAAWDERVGGYEAGLFYITAARPGVGKTAKALKNALSMAASGAPVVFFSKEMSREQLAWRAISMDSGVDYDTLRRGRFYDDPEAVERVMEAQRTFNKLPLFIDDASGLTMAQIKLRAKSLQRRTDGRLAAAFIDTVNKVSPSGQHVRHNLHMHMSEVAGACKDMAKELGLAVVALCQLSRAVEQRDDKRPVLSDLRESGALEENADVVEFLYRHVYYLRQQMGEKLGEGVEAAFSRRAKLQEQINQCQDNAECIISKLRHGQPGTLHFGFDEKRTLWFERGGHRA